MRDSRQRSNHWVRERRRIYACHRCGCEIDLIGLARPVKCHSGCNSYGWEVTQRGKDAGTKPLRRGSLRSCGLPPYLNPGVSGEGDS